jgi:TonB family protein
MRRTAHLISVALALVTSSAVARAQEDIQLREKAITLVERANVASMARPFAPYEQTIVFRVYSPGKGTQEGRFTSVTIGPRSYRDEYEYGDFRLLVVVNGDMIADVGNRAVAPLEVRKLTTLNPIYHVSFDRSDVIRDIQEVSVAGRAAECIDFETIVGEKHDTNQICVDRQLGTLVRVRTGGETITNSDFFRLHGANYPARISYENGEIRLDLEQTMTHFDGTPDPNLLVAPPDAKVMHVCLAYVRPYGQNLPQPKPGTGTQNVDVMLHGTIGPDGKIHDAMINRSGRDDLNNEALKIFSTWTFTPAVCNGKPIEVPADVTLHFQNR